MSKKATLDVQTDNDFEKKLLAEVIPPGEVGIGFGDIGALDNVKSTLREVRIDPSCLSHQPSGSSTVNRESSAAWKACMLQVSIPGTSLTCSSLVFLLHARPLSCTS